MTTIEHRELKGITIKNLLVTIISTASIVASVLTTYFNLKTELLGVKASQETEARINNIRLKLLEDEVTILQKQVDDIKTGNRQVRIPPINKQLFKTSALFTAIN